MMTIRFYGDEHLARAVAESLVARSIDIVLAVDVGMTGASDEEHLARAASEGRSIITRDHDFLRLNSEGCQHAGIVFLTRRWGIGELVRELAELRIRVTAEEMIGRVEYC